MEWIETIGASVEEALEKALDRLGVAEDELDYEILVEPTSSLFGLRRTDARLRARVRPVRPRAKEERRDRGRRRGQKGDSDQRGGSPSSASRAGKGDSDTGSDRGNNKTTDRGSSRNSRASRDFKGRPRSRKRSTARAQSDGSGGPAPSRDASPPDAKKTVRRDTSRRDRRHRQGLPERAENDDNGRSDEQEGVEVKQMDLKTQAQVTEDFVRGLLEQMGLEARVVSSISEDRVLVEAQGLNLGLAIGKRGETVRAITQLARTMVQRMSDGNAEGSLVVDVGGYRERRRSFLTEFATSQAEEALADGRSRAFEPMNAADRKVIHDAVTEISGVTTHSEGSDMARHVVIVIESQG